MIRGLKKFDNFQKNTKFDKKQKFCNDSAYLYQVLRQLLQDIFFPLSQKNSSSFQKKFVQRHASNICVRFEEIVNNLRSKKLQCILFLYY